MSEQHSRAFAQGREDHEARNQRRASCPPVDVWTYAPRYLAYTVMYERGWNSVEDVPIHSCPACRTGGAGS